MGFGEILQKGPFLQKVGDSKIMELQGWCKKSVTIPEDISVTKVKLMCEYFIKFSNPSTKMFKCYLVSAKY